MNTLFLMTTLALIQQGTGAAAQRAAETQVMTGNGWLFMSAAWVFILSLTFYTFGKILRGGRK